MLRFIEDREAALTLLSGKAVYDLQTPFFQPEGM